MDKELSSVFVTTIKSAFGIAPDVLPELSDKQIMEIYDLASRQSMLPIALEGLKKMGYTRILVKDIQKLNAKEVLRHYNRVETFGKISSIFGNLGIKFVPLKGLFVSSLYPEPWMRTSCDIDILVHEDDLEKAIKALESQSDFELKTREFHDVLLTNKWVSLELHFSALSNIECLDKVLANVWDYVVPSGDGCRCDFTPEFQLFFIVSHAAKHLMTWGGMGVRPLLDIWLLREKTKYDESVLKKLCSESGILGFYDTCCSLLDVWFKGAEHSDVTREFEELLLSGGVFGSSRSLALRNDRKNKGFKYILSRMFMSRRELMERFPESQKHPNLVPFYQFKRWALLLKSKNRQKAQSEMRQARDLGQEEKDRYNKLLGSMGL